MLSKRSESMEKRLKPQALQIGDWTADPSSGLLVSGDRKVVLRPREMAVLLALSDQAGQVVTTEALLDQVWSGVVVGTDSVYFAVSQLRKALGDDRDTPRYIETIPKRGYRLIAAVSTPTIAADDGPSASPLRQQKYRLAAGLGLLVALAALLLPVTGILPGDEKPEAVSIAVMPFIDLSESQDQAYFSDGVAEELRDYLARLPGLRVISRSPSALVRESDLETWEIGEHLGVSKLLEGSIRRQGGNVRIAAQLVDAHSGFQLWSETFDLPIENMLVVQDQIGRAIAQALQLKLLAFEAPQTRSTQPQAYDLYLQGLQGLRTNSYASLRRAANQLAEASRLDPQFADAYAALAMCRYVLHATGADLNAQALTQARILAQRALALDPAMARAHIVLGQIAMDENNAAQAAAHFRNAVRYAPGTGDTLVKLAKSLILTGELAESDALFQRALLSDPLNPRVHSAYAHYQETMGQTSTAMAAYQRAVDLNPEDPNSYWSIARLESERGNQAQAIQALVTAAELDPLDYEIAAHLALAYARLGLHDQAATWNAKALELGPNSLLVRASSAMITRARGEMQAGLQLALSVLADNSLRDSHNARRSLRLLAVRELLLQDRIDEVITLIVDSGENNRIAAYLEGPPAQNFHDFMLLQIDANELLVLGEAYRRRDDQQALAQVLSHLQATDLANISAFRNVSRTGDLLIEAQLQMLHGNEAPALERLKQATELGFSSQLDLSVLVRMLGVEDAPAVRDIEAQLADRRLNELARVQSSLAQI